MDYKEFFKEYGNRDLMYHTYPECSGEIQVEDLYQAIRERLLVEIISSFPEIAKASEIAEILCKSAPELNGRNE